MFAKASNSTDTLPVLNQRYRLEERLASGSDSHVYRAQDLLRGYPVLVKEFLPSALQDWKRFQLIEREAKILAQLNHIEIPNFVDFFTVGEDEQSLYLVSKWIHGQTLAQKLATGWRASLEEIYDLAEMALRLLIYIHGFNPPIVHRDIKPSNLMLSQYGRLFLLDFGGVQEAMENQGAGGSTLVGTLGYMAPEQLMGRAEPASDLYALGMTLLVCLTGLEPEAIPFREGNLDVESDSAFSEQFSALDKRSQIWFQSLLAQDLAQRYDQAQMVLLELDTLRYGGPKERTIYLPENHRANVPEIIHSLTLIERSESDTHLLAGSLLQGRFEIGQLLGSGTHSRVYAGRYQPLNKAVIIKELSLEEIENWKNLELFEREIETMKLLRHPRIPRFVDAFQIREEQRLSWYLVTEALEAQGLDERLAEGWRPDDETVWEIAAQVLEILIYLHEEAPPLLHRDIKPSNLLLQTEDETVEVYLIDFGAVQNRFWASGGGGSTIIGTFGYMAPETFSGAALPASDLYALGATLVNVLSGKHPIEIPLESDGMQFEAFVRCDEFYSVWLKALLHPQAEQRLGSAREALELLQDARQGGTRAQSWLQARKQLIQVQTGKSAHSARRRVVPSELGPGQVCDFLAGTELRSWVLLDRHDLPMAVIQLPPDMRLAQTCLSLWMDLRYPLLLGGFWLLSPLSFALPLRPISTILVFLVLLYLSYWYYQGRDQRLPLKYRDYQAWYQSSSYPERHPIVNLNARLSLSQQGLTLAYQHGPGRHTERFDVPWTNVESLNLQPLKPEFASWEDFVERPLQEFRVHLHQPEFFSSGDTTYKLETYKAYFSLSQKDAERLLELLLAVQKHVAELY